MDADWRLTTAVKNTIDEIKTFQGYVTWSEDSKYMRQLIGKLRDCNVVQ